MTASLERGKPAPAGFSVTVSAYLRQDLARRQLVSPSAPTSIKERWRAVDAAAHEPAARGDSDPLVRCLWRATVAEFGEGVPSWAPGPNQKAVLDMAVASGPGYDFELAEGRLLGALAHAATLDLEAALARRLADARRHEDLPPTSAALLAEANARATSAERALSDARQTIEQLRQAHMAEKAKRRNLQTILQTGTPLPEVNGDSGSEDLPTGVRRRGDKFQAYARVNGEQRSKTFDNLDEAVGQYRAWQAEREPVPA